METFENIDEATRTETHHITQGETKRRNKGTTKRARRENRRE